MKPSAHNNHHPTPRRVRNDGSVWETPPRPASRSLLGVILLLGILGAVALWKAFT